MVYIVDGCRTPYLKAKAQPGPFSAADLAVAAGRELLLRQPFAANQIDETILGCVMPRESEANIARIVSLRLGCGDQTPAWTVQRNCASGMQALDCAMKDIQLGRSDLVLAGGTEAMSRAPIILRTEMASWLGAIRSGDFKKKWSELNRFHPYFLKPVSGLVQGLTDPLTDLTMGQTAEILAHRFHISRQELDQFALCSHQRLARAYDNNYLSELTALYDYAGNYYVEDSGLRRDTSLDQLNRLPAYFDKPFGSITAGNSSQVTDGAALLILASEQAVQKYHLPILGRIIDVQWAAIAPQWMGLGPVMAATPLLLRNQLTLKDIDYWEINEAFAAQVLACLAAWQDDQYCQRYLGLPQAFGTIDLERLNVDGGAIALGHPVGASGARIVLHLLQVLKRLNGRLGVAAICIGGGQGGAMLLESNI
ncbi:MAG: acetyl-CoA C-acetyltransferase [Proteobacteria bacterium]|nr:acetyl-CoA C-acetyltransferase [Pseudomonadota bacterium]